jgi:hypothetical protein
MDKKTYFYFKAKTISELVVTFIGAANVINYCTSCTSVASFIIQIQNAYLANGTTTIAYTFLGFMELMVVYDRYVMVKPSSRLNFKVNRWVFVGVFLAVSTVASIPNYVQNEIIAKPNSQAYQTVSSDFGKSQFNTYYQICYSFGRSLVYCVLLPIIGILLVIEFRKFISKKNLLVTKNTATDLVRSPGVSNTKATALFKSQVGPQSMVSTAPANSLVVVQVGTGANNTKERERMEYNAEKNVTSMVIVMTVVFVISRLLQLASQCYNQYLRGINAQTASGLYFMYVAYHLTYYVTTSINFAIYYQYNNAFRKCFVRICKKIFGRRLCFK